jgi:hypothetical protein
MTPRALLAAFLVGLVGFVAVEFAAQTLGVITALTPSLIADALIYALTTVLLYRWLAPSLRRTRGLGLLLYPLLLLLLFAPVAGLLGGAVSLTLAGQWGDGALVASALGLGPLNLMVALTVEVGVVALPLGLGSVALLTVLARR